MFAISAKLDLCCSRTHTLQLPRAVARFARRADQFFMRQRVMVRHQTGNVMAQRNHAGPVSVATSMTASVQSVQRRSARRTAPDGLQHRYSALQPSDRTWEQVRRPTMRVRPA